jgi:hypothetical protein
MCQEWHSSRVSEKRKRRQTRCKVELQCGLLQCRPISGGAVGYSDLEELDDDEYEEEEDEE